MVKFFLRN